MEAKEIKKMFDKEYGFDLSDRARPEDMVFARRMYVKACMDYHITYVQIGKAIGRTHATVLHHKRNMYYIPKKHKKKFNYIVLKYGLDCELFSLTKDEMLLEKRRERNQEIFDKFYKLKELTDEELETFAKTRLEPYLKMINKY